jgi:beta-N-acetylhexosaminidase
MTEPSIERVIGRMLMVGLRGASPFDPDFTHDIGVCRDTGVGGVILFDVDMPTYSTRMAAGDSTVEARRASPRNIESPMQALFLTGRIAERLGHVLIGVDQEGGSVARLAPSRGFDELPSATKFGTLSDRAQAVAAEQLANSIAQAGFNTSFAPCVDLSLNPANTVVVANERCYSPDPDVVARSAMAVCRAFDAAGIAACLKHFPGHGSSSGDSHLGFVDITRSHRADLELGPYRTLIGAGGAPVPMVMTGHLFHADIDASHPASLSREHTTLLLRRRLGFEGVIVTDSLDMGAIAQRYGPDEACVLAVNAGADLLLDANNAPGPARACPAPAMHEAILRALRDGRILGGEERIRESVRRVARLGWAVRTHPGMGGGPLPDARR